VQFPQTCHEICINIFKKITIPNISHKIGVGLLNFIVLLKPDLKGCGYNTLGLLCF
jgi:hypothetical protein